MNEVAIWSLEEQFWMEAEIYYRSALDPECIMGFPAPVGIIVGKAILESLDMVGPPDLKLCPPDLGLSLTRADQSQVKARTTDSLKQRKVARHR